MSLLYIHIQIARSASATMEALQDIQRLTCLGGGIGRRVGLKIQSD